MARDCKRKSRVVERIRRSHASIWTNKFANIKLAMLMLTQRTFGTLVLFVTQLGLARLGALIQMVCKYRGRH